VCIARQSRKNNCPANSATSMSFETDAATAGDDRTFSGRKQ
jgi:hypothetical protein